MGGLPSSTRWGWGESSARFSRRSCGCTTSGSRTTDERHRSPPGRTGRGHAAFP
ncbi:MAG: hypothetical protein AVDCRST_MAG19-4774 [uncultured Thermomicrobiales bacterium]|uniref:Uncharacterized protein n=1 Tax=uncultured Thermomicrobiales bacterium TaxID=1645740 RepID=A0A6J4VQA3_9BACT|nr:MAG: hypothetical protein AVDCRST_MAG19-4774 [uncultured Thermomicrobiales bacterium]